MMPILEKKSQSNDLSFQLKKQKKKTNPKVQRNNKDQK